MMLLFPRTNTAHIQPAYKFPSFRDARHVTLNHDLATRHVKFTTVLITIQNATV